MDEKTGLVKKKKEYRNSKFEKYRRIKFFNSLGQITENIKLDLDEKNEVNFKEKIKYSLDDQHNIKAVEIKRLVDGCYQDLKINYQYRFKRLVKVGNHTSIKYDLLGNPSVIQSRVGTFKYKYKYDLKGNWVKLNVIFNGSGNKLEQLFTRTYEYE